jgi:hypothetical protein
MLSPAFDQSPGNGYKKPIGLRNNTSVECRNAAMDSTNSQPTSRREAIGLAVLRIVFKGILYLPWVWLLLFLLFVLVTALQVGHLPAYGQPDPKDASLGFLTTPLLILLLVTMAAAPFGIALAIAKLWQDIPSFVGRREVLVYLAGTALFFLFIFSDAAGLITWLAD